MNALQAMVGSTGILLMSSITLPMVGSVFGASITPGQGASMGLVLFVLRFFWLWAVCAVFERTKE